MLEYLAHFFFLYLLLLLFPLTLDVIIVRTVDEKLQWLDQRFKMFVQHDILLDSTGLQSAMFLVTRLARLLDLPRDFFTLTLTYICHVCLAKYRQ